MNLGPVALKSVSCLNKQRNLINIQRRWNLFNFGELSESIDCRPSFHISLTLIGMTLKLTIKHETGHFYLPQSLINTKYFLKFWVYPWWSIGLGSGEWTERSEVQILVKERFFFLYHYKLAISGLFLKYLFSQLKLLKNLVFICCITII